MPDVHATGGCLCGGVRYEINVPLTPVCVCHCRQCRQTSGYQLGFSNCMEEDMSFVKQGTLQWYASSEKGRRGFCNNCGSTLFWRSVDGGEMDIAAGSLDEPTGLKTEEHIFTEFKGDYYEIDDGMPQHLRGRR
ncbi:MAG: GFA family protein [Alphaproteobacteria bacterium]|nr:MAG: GFA family protein [Alphaproteobacteria bacterium]